MMRPTALMTGLLSSLFLLGTLLAAPIPAPEKRPFGVEDLYLIKTLGGLDLAPDGHQIVYQLTSRDLPRGQSNRDVYRVAALGGKAQRLTTTPERFESSPIFSPDGTQIAFVADRGEGTQLWLLPSAGGEARALTHLSTGVSSPLWSPDGRHIAFVSKVDPACGADDACHRAREKRRKAIPLEVHLADELLYRHWDAWYDGRVPHVLLVDVDTGIVRDMTPGPREAPAHFGGEAIAFSPDGRYIAYTRNPDPRDCLAWSTNTDIFLVEIDPDERGGLRPAQNITEANEAFDGNPAFSPDGRYIAYLRYARPHFEADRPRLTLYDRQSGLRREIMGDFGEHLRQFAWAPNSQGIYFTADVRGSTPLFYVSVEGGKPELRVEFATIHDFVISPDGRYAFALRSAIASPGELWRFDTSGATPPLRITMHNLRLEQEVDLRSAESVLIDGASGHKVQTWLIRPHSFDPSKKYPLVINVHGGPQYEWTDSFRGDWQVFPGAGYVLAFPNPHGSTGFGQAYTDAISGDWAGRVYEDLLAVSDHLAALPYVDEQRIGAMGWSWGGYMMNWMIGHTDRFKAAASMMGIYDLASFWGTTEELWFPEWDLGGLPWNSQDYTRFNPASAAREMGRLKVPTLIISGEKDFRIPYTQSLELFTVLRRQGVPARLIVFPNAGHWPNWYEMALYHTAHLEWFHEYLGGAAPPFSVEAFIAGEAFTTEGE